MKRRTFIQTTITATLATALPPSLLAASRRPAVETVVRRVQPLGLFPQVSGPRMVGGAAETTAVVEDTRGTVWIRGKSRRSLGELRNPRVVTGPAGDIHCVGRQQDKLIQIRFDGDRLAAPSVLAEHSASFPAVGLAATHTGDQVRVAAPREPRTLYLFSADGQAPRPIVHSRWVHPLLAYDARRGRLHLVFSPWANLSGLYSGLYYLRSDDLGSSWTTSAGAPVKTPFKPAPPEHPGGGIEPELLAPRGQGAGGFAHTLAHSLVLDAEGLPHVLFSFCRPYWVAAGSDPQMRTMLARSTGTAWERHEIGPEFMHDIGGGSLAFDDRGELHAVVSFTKRYAHWLDLGLTRFNTLTKKWDPVTPLTADAIARQEHRLAPQFRWHGNEGECLYAIASRSGSWRIARVTWPRDLS